jgi:hypothetical protein
LYPSIVVHIPLDFTGPSRKQTCNASVPCNILLVKKIIRPVIEHSMKLIVPFTLFMAFGFILAAGCVAMANKTAVNAAVNPTTPAEFTSYSTTSDLVLNETINDTINATANSTSTLNGSLRVSLSGITYPAILSVVLDNETVGTVNPTTPLYLMISEGDHTVMVCMSSVCEQENVTTRFGRYVTVDFSERLQKDVKFPNPTARPTAQILDYFKNGNTISVNVEFINPSKEDLLMSVSISCGYRYIDDRTSIKMGDSAKGMLVQNVKAGQRITEGLDLHFVSGHSYSYDCPVIEELKIK